MKHFSQRLRMARKMNGWSMQDLSNLLDNKVSKQAISRYENGDMLPERANFLALLKVLNVKEDFFHRGEITIELNPSFRKMKDLPKQQKEAIIERTKDYLERYLETESILATQSRFNYTSDIHCQHVDDAEKVAAEFREKNNLGTDPIFNLTELLEDLGIKVFQYSFGHDDISGMSDWVNRSEGIAVIFVNASHPIDRRRFTIAHELGHLILDIDKSLSNTHIEKCCHRFAAALLMPKQRMIDELGTKRKSIHIKELQFIKEQYGISPQALLYRAKDLNIISEHHRRQRFEYLKSVGLEKEEIGTYKGNENTNQLLQLLCRGIAEGTLSMAKAASLYNMRVADFRDILALK